MAPALRSLARLQLAKLHTFASPVAMLSLVAEEMVEYRMESMEATGGKRGTMAERRA